MKRHLHLRTPWLTVGFIGLASLAVALVLVFGLGPGNGSGSSGFEVVFIDVGQGDAELITIGGERLLIDGGRSGTLVVGRLRALGVTHLDAVLATHPDADHIGGLAAVLEAYGVRRVYVNGETNDTDAYAAFLEAASAQRSASIITLARGQAVALGGRELAVLNGSNGSAPANDQSIVLRLACGSVSVLFTGDAEAGAERSLIEAGLADHADVLKVGHHGSNASSSLPFLQAVHPEVAIISAGRTNQYGHPSPETLDRLRSVGAKILSTDTTTHDDSVTMKSDCTTYSFSDANTR